MSTVRTEPEDGTVSIQLNKEEAQRLFALLYNVEECGWDGCTFKDSDQPLWAQLVDAKVAPPFSTQIGPVLPHSVVIVDRPFKVRTLVDQVLAVLPANASIQATEGSQSTVLSVTVPR